ncbi:unnamed protein product [Caenorhabditis bovis]|uniref:Uncharacterized protein n=1 Tax=Caenorhabditis bovis TaxID=2654633 RepID=A0A8S1EEL0_9PELO|nr:unnamed protein product [Caenorhabditis bovis]
MAEVRAVEKPQLDYVQLIQEFVDKRGQSIQKTLVKKLWSVHEDILNNCDDFQLRMMFFTPTIASCSEGVKLLASFFTKITTPTVFRLIQKLIVEYGATTSDCQKFGEIIRTAWNMADHVCQYDLKEEIETNIIAEVCYSAVYAHKPYCQRYQDILGPLAIEKKSNKEFEEMIISKLNSCLFQGLSSVNDIVRASSADVFFKFYPLTDSDPEIMAKNLQEQHKIMLDLLNDSSIPIRVDAIKNVLRCLGEYWLVIPKDVVRVLFSHIVDTLSNDSVVSVRVAVYEGLMKVALIPACMNAFEHALKCVCPSGINDKSDKVRLSTFQLLNLLKKHKFIKVFDIVSKDEIIARLDVELVEDVRKKIVPLVHMLLPISKEFDENYYKPRINYIIGKSRLAILTYFRLLYPMNLIEIDDAIKLTEMLLIWAYRYLRVKSNESPLAEDSTEYKRARVYLECAVVIYLSIRANFIANEKAAEKKKIEKILAKLIEEVFDKYRDTPIIGTATAISGHMPKDVLKTMASTMFSMLDNDEAAEEVIEPFLETVFHYNTEMLLENIDKGLAILPEYVKSLKDPKKATSFEKNSDPDQFSKALRFLKYITKSHTTNVVINTQDMYRMTISEYIKKLDYVRTVIDLYISKEPSASKIFENEEPLFVALEMRLILKTLLITYSSNIDEESLKEIIEYQNDIVEFLDWFKANIVAKLGQIPEDKIDFVVKIAKSVLETVSVCFSAWNFSQQLELTKENDDGMEEDEMQSSKSVINVLSQVVISFCNSSTPMELFAPVLKMAATMCDYEYAECHSTMMNVLDFAPKWIKKFIEFEEEADINEKELSDALKLLFKKLLDTDVWTDNSQKKLANLIVLLSIAELTDAADEVEIEDPSSHDYVPPKLVSIMVLKFVIKEKTLLKTFLVELKALLTSQKFINNDISADICAVRLGAVGQLLVMIQNGTKEAQDYVTNLMQTCKEMTSKVLEENEDVKAFYRSSLQTLLKL